MGNKKGLDKRYTVLDSSYDAIENSTNRKFTLHDKVSVKAESYTEVTVTSRSPKYLHDAIQKEIEDAVLEVCMKYSKFVTGLKVTNMSDYNISDNVQQFCVYVNIHGHVASGSEEKAKQLSNKICDRYQIIGKILSYNLEDAALNTTQIPNRFNGMTLPRAGFSTYARFIFKKATSYEEVLATMEGIDSFVDDILIMVKEDPDNIVMNEEAGIPYTGILEIVGGRQYHV